MTSAERPPHIALDFASSWDPRGGVWRYGVELARALAARLPGGAVRVPCYDRLPDDRLAEIRGTGATVRPHPVVSRVDRLDSMSNVNGRYVPWSRVLPLVYRPWVRRRLFEAGVAGCDVYHAVWACRQRPARAAVVGTIHDMIPYRYPGVCGLTDEYHRRLVAGHLRWADRIITPSAASRADLLRFTDADPARVTVVHHGIDHTAFHPGVPRPHALLADHRLTAGRFFLYVGALEKRKNIDGMVRAYLDAVPVAADIPLVLAGARLHDSAAVARAVADGDPRVRVIGYVPEHDLAGLYAAARGLIHVAFVEGFGFTPLEAMACGTPVVVSAIGASAEVVGEAGIPVDPHDEADMARGIRALAADDDLRDRLAAAGVARARQFTWAKSAADTLGVYAEAANARTQLPAATSDTAPARTST